MGGAVDLFLVLVFNAYVSLFIIKRANSLFTEALLCLTIPSW